MTRYSLFVLKVSLKHQQNKNKTNIDLHIGCVMFHIKNSSKQSLSETETSTM